MVQSNANQVLNNLKRRMTLAERRSEVELDRASESIGRRFLQAMIQRQPDGSKNPDPMVTKGLLNRHPRPSIRQGNIPISQGWVGPTVEKPSTWERVVRIKSRSPHMHYFTTWTGRSYLGTRGGKPIVAKRAKTLAFWWMGEARFPRAVYEHEGFRPDSDFVQDAWDSLDGYIMAEKRRVAGLVVETMKSG